MTGRAKNMLSSNRALRRGIVQDSDHGRSRSLRHKSMPQVSREPQTKRSLRTATQLLDHLRIAEADLLGFSLGGLVAYAVALGAPARVGKLIVASADAHRPPGRG